MLSTNVLKRMESGMDTTGVSMKHKAGKAMRTGRKPVTRYPWDRILPKVSTSHRVCRAGTRRLPHQTGGCRWLPRRLRICLDKHHRYRWPFHQLNTLVENRSEFPHACTGRERHRRYNSFRWPLRTASLFVQPAIG